jgi:uncharacterized protein involved in exopolysaccharide biosynthesis
MFQHEDAAAAHLVGHGGWMVIEARDVNRPDRRLPPAEGDDPLLSRAGRSEARDGEARPLDEAKRRERSGEPSSPGRAVGWRLIALLILPMIVGALGAFAVASRDRPVYAVRSEVMSDPRQLTWDSADRVLATRIVVAQSPALLVPVAEALHMPVGDLAGSFTAETVGNSAVIRLEYRNPDRTLALNVVKALTDRYLATLREFEPRDSTPPRVLTPSMVIGEPVAPKPWRSAALGAAAGLAFAAAAIILLSQTRRRSWA